MNIRIHTAHMPSRRLFLVQSFLFIMFRLCNNSHSSLKEWLLWDVRVRVPSRIGWWIGQNLFLMQLWHGAVRVFLSLSKTRSAVASLYFLFSYYIIYACNISKTDHNRISDSTLCVNQILPRCSESQTLRAIRAYSQIQTGSFATHLKTESIAKSESPQIPLFLAHIQNPTLVWEQGLR